MGVSGCGKSTVGAQLAALLGAEFLEGDSLHPPRNVALMAAGTPLTDADRADWLVTIADRLAAAQQGGRALVVSCSALKRAYRDRLRLSCAGLRWVHLQGSATQLQARLAGRRGHYMPPSLLASQLATLEAPAPDEAVLVLGIDSPAPVLAQRAAAHLLAAAVAPCTPLSSLTPPVAAMTDPVPATFTQVLLFTDTDGRARFRERSIPLTEGKPQARLSALMPSGGCQLRHSPVGFRSEFHCTGEPQWVFILGGQMEIGLQDGSSRVFKPGDHFYSADTLPAGACFDPAVHGHWSRQLGPEPLVTVFVRG